MAFPELLPGTTFKKNYNFLWYVTAGSDNSSVLGKLMSTLLSVAATAYVSQLAEKISLPDDEVEYDTVKIANLEFKVGKGIKMNDFTVTYLDDSLNSVYQFHNSWQKLVRNDGLSMTPLKSICGTGTYITTENAMTVTEYQTVFSQLYNSNNGTGNSVDYSLIETALEAIGTKPTSITTFPNIYPTKISRGEMSKDGQDLARVTVTYTRVPELKRSHVPLMKLTNTDVYTQRWQSAALVDKELLAKK